MPSRADPPHAGHRDGHVDPAQERDGAICTLSLSFNNDGPLGTFFRYIGDKGTYIARYDDLVDGRENAIDVSQVDVSMNGIELQDREFIAAIREGPRAQFQRAESVRLLSRAGRAGSAAERGQIGQKQAGRARGALPAVGAGRALAKLIATQANLVCRGWTINSTNFMEYKHHTKETPPPCPSLPDRVSPAVPCWAEGWRWWGPGWPGAIAQAARCAWQSPARARMTPNCCSAMPG
jgi:hypothetical protein